MPQDPSYNSSKVYYSFKRSSTAMEENGWWVHSGETYATALTRENMVKNLNNYTVFVNGAPLSDLNVPVTMDAKVVLQSRNYDSGVSAKAA